MALRDEALTWWAETIHSGNHVVSGQDIKDQRRRAFLVKEKLLCQVARGFYLLKRPEDELQDILPLLYWQIVKTILSRYTWSVRGRSAVLLHTGDERTQNTLLVRTKEKTNWKVPLAGVDISLTYDPGFDSRMIKTIEVAGARIPVDIPEKVLIDASSLPAGELRTFVAGTRFHFRTLEALYAEKPKPIVFKRLVDRSKTADRPDLVGELENIIASYTPYLVSKREKVESGLLSAAASLTPAWAMRQASHFEDFEGILERELGNAMRDIKQHRLDKLLEIAREHKKYDTYHSTTLEGYRITPEEVDSLLSGLIPENRKADEGKYIDEVRNRMAILGYGEAFDFVLGRVETQSEKPLVTEDLVKETYFHLFKPSADAGIVDYPSLVSYRNASAFIRGSSYVPPGHSKLVDLMAGYEASVNKVKNPVVKAILAHYFFVTIHPYIDGNGRTARLLMNYLLTVSGYSWLTIRADQRTEYFNALKEGQLNDDILPFGTFIVGMLAKQY